MLGLRPRTFNSSLEKVQSQIWYTLYVEKPISIKPKTYFLDHFLDALASQEVGMSVSLSVTHGK